ncbi:hypothetical protein EON67_03210 [archaeon]|nr:MAG: hypothetical protein EON67_03210 [archaeon]
MSSAESEFGLRRVKGWKCAGGDIGVWSHRSNTLQCDMSFSIFLPSSVSSLHRAPVRMRQRRAIIVCRHAA